MKKKISEIIGTALLAVSFFVTGCSSGEDSSSGLSLPAASETVPAGCLRVNYIGTGSFYIWAWKDVDATELAKCTSWSAGGISMDHSNGNFTCVDIKIADPASCVGLIVKSYDGKTKYTGDSDALFYFPKKYNQIYFSSGSSTIYVDSALTKEPYGTSSASITDRRQITLNCNGVSLSDSTVKLTDKNGAAVTVSSYGTNTVNVADDMQPSYASKAPYKIAVTDNDGNTDTVTAGISSTLVESWFGTTALSSLAGSGTLQPGITVSGTTASFKTWAPVASSCQLLLFTDASNLSIPAIDPINMTVDANGFWTVENVSVSGYKYYKYRITNNDVSHDIADIWAFAASGDSVASQIISIDDSSAKPASWELSYTNPFGNTGSQTKAYTDAVVYEIHIRDWSRAFVKNSTGKFEDITAALNNSGKFAAHLKDLGITHVQILPMFDYAQTNSNKEYNWGYNPYDYNVPEGRYVNYGSAKDGTDAVLQMREMIKAFHDAGIAVNMDVVYNHTSGTGSGSLYDMTVPEYFYRITSNGSYSNGSGCGNEIATNHVMVKKYVIDSLKHWMNDYHINGFRFDLMGCHEESTMKEIYKELSAIDKNVMVYGEPWTGGTSAVIGGLTSSTKGEIDNCADTTYSTNGVACFDDTFRNALKGAEFGGFQQGHVQGTYKDAAMVEGLKGSTASVDVIGRFINYAECHDNYTLFDKLAISYLNKTAYSGDLFAAIGTDGLAAVKKQEQLAAAFIFLAQGTPFINGGQEFMRTKQGNPNSYASDDSINEIDLSFAAAYSDVYNTYKGLIALRKANTAAFGGNTSAASSTPVTGITKYTTGDFLVYFNATAALYTIDTTGYTAVVDVTSGIPTTSTTLPATVAAKSFVILKK